MQANFFRFYVTVLLLTSTMCLHHVETNRVSENDANFPCWKKRPPKIRQERATHVKAILANPKLSQSQILAEKFAEETLKSPKTLETLKKLTEVESSNDLINNKNQVRRKVKNTRDSHSNSKKVPSKSRRRSRRKHHSHKRKQKKKNRKKKHRHFHQRNPKRRSSQNAEDKIGRIRKRDPITFRSKSKNAHDDTNIKKFKTYVKRSDSGCILDKSQLLSTGNILPLSEVIPLDSMMPPKSRLIREIVKNSSNLHSKKRRGYYDNPYKSSLDRRNDMEYGFYDPNFPVPVDNMMLPDDYKMAEMPQRPVGAYSFNKRFDDHNIYNADSSQEQQDPDPAYENTGSVNTRALHMSENEITTDENQTSNCTTLKPDHHRSTISLEAEAAVDQHHNRHSTGSETKQVANEILNEIIEELEELKVGRNQDNPGEGLPCKISGTWMTTAAGVELKMKVSNHTMIVSIEKTKQLGNSIQNQILNTTWNITGHVPFQRGAPFSLVASNNHAKSLAAFVGACKVCQGVDIIEGVWTVIHEPKTCRDFQVSTSVHNDIFRRSNVHEDQVKHKELPKSEKNNGTSTTHPAD